MSEDTFKFWKSARDQLEEEKPQLRVGDQVVLRGLTRADLNSKKGEVEGWVEQTNRWAIKLIETHNDRIYHIKLENLE